MTDATRLEAEPTVITAPGVYDLSEREYHADPVPGGSLSSSGARKLLAPGCPALFRYERDHPTPPSDEMNLGSAVHRLVLGKGAEIMVLRDEDGDPYPDLKKPAARRAKAAALAEGKIPLLHKQLQIAEAMAAAIKADRDAGPLFAAGTGQAEQSIFWQDGPVWRRALIDWLRPGADRMIIADYKSTAKPLDDESLSKTMAGYGYHQQLAWYRDAVRAVGLCEKPAALLVFQMTVDPHLVRVVEPDPVALRVGDHLNRQAVDLYAECVRTGLWPGYGGSIDMISLPPYIERLYEREVW